MTAMFFVAALFNGSLAIAQDGLRVFRFDRVAVVTALALATCTILGNLGLGLALPDIGAGMTSVVMKSQVILTPILALWLLKEAAPSRLWAGAIVALAGVAAPQLLAETPRGGTGYAWAFMAAVAFALMQIVTRKVIARIHAASVNALRLVLAVAVLHAHPDGAAVWGLSSTVWTYAAWAGILGPGVSRLCLMAALHHISPSWTALVALSGTVFAFGLGWVYFGELPTGFELAGALLIGVGVAWAILPSLRTGRRSSFEHRP